jgi:tRNA nucleotidyltransferase (CCA-adding enzyme)
MEKVYVVGGAVRDVLLGREPKDIDYVWVGQTAEAMLDLGYEQVGADFPVFLDSDGNEHALARKERKVAAGYNGFETDFDPSVTLEDDLVRRDLTINAMAVPVAYWDDFVGGDDGVLVDPFHGRVDLDNGLLRHVSEAFAEDPVRVLRVARFAARFEFDVSLTTVALMKSLVDEGELDTLVPERVWAETERALTETNPMAFFNTLKACGALVKLFPEVETNDLLEVNLGADLCDARSKFALMCLDMDFQAINDMCDRLKVPNDFRQLAVRSLGFTTLLRKGFDAEEYVNELELMRATHDKTNFVDVMWVADRSAFNTRQFRVRLDEAARAFPDVFDVRFDNLTDEQKNSLKGPEVGTALHNLRVETAAQKLA